MFKPYSFGILFLLVSGVCAAQKQVEHQQLVWFVYVNSIRFNDSWLLVTELQERRFTNPGAQHQFLIRSHLHRVLGSGWDAAVGMCLFYQSPQDPQSSSNLTVPEIRPHVEFNHHQQLRVLSIDQRYKVEMRFFRNVNDLVTNLEDGFQYGTFRFRYQLILSVPILKLGDVCVLKLRAGDEIMFNVGKKIVYNFFDQNRLFAGINVNVSPSFTLEAGYVNWFQQQFSGIDYYNRDIFRLALYHSIHPKQSL